MDVRGDLLLCVRLGIDPVWTLYGPCMDTLGMDDVVTKPFKLGILIVLSHTPICLIVLSLPYAHDMFIQCMPHACMTTTKRDLSSLSCRSRSKCFQQRTAHNHTKALTRRALALVPRTPPLAPLPHDVNVSCVSEEELSNPKSSIVWSCLCPRR